MTIVSLPCSREGGKQIEIGCSARQGLGMNTKQLWSSASTVQRRALFQEEIQKEEEETRRVKIWEVRESGQSGRHQKGS